MRSEAESEVAPKKEIGNCGANATGTNLDLWLTTLRTVETIKARRVIKLAGEDWKTGKSFDIDRPERATYSLSPSSNQDAEQNSIRAENSEACIHQPRGGGGDLVSYLTPQLCLT